MAGSTSRSGATDDDAAMMKKLVLSEEDPDDVVVEEEDAISEDSTRWMVITGVHLLVKHLGTSYGRTLDLSGKRGDSATT